MTRKPVNRGFTLAEVLIATILIGMAIAALVAANGTFSMANGAGADLSTAEFLIEQIRELTTMLAVVDPETETDVFGPEEPNMVSFADIDDLDDLNGMVFSPPINASGMPLTTYTAYSQHVTVQNVSHSDLSLVVPNHSSPFVRVTVSVRQKGIEVTSASWIRARY